MLPMLRPTTSPSDAPRDPDDDEPAEHYIGNRIADEDAPSGPDEVERLAGQIVRAERRLRMIEELSERSMALARLAHDRAMDDGRRAAEATADSESPGGAAAPAGVPPATPNPEASAATYAKLSRTVRLCLEMEARASKWRPAPTKPCATCKTAFPPFARRAAPGSNGKPRSAARKSSTRFWR